MPEIVTLDNGLRVVYEQLPYLRSVNVGLFVRSGSALEAEDEGGMSHFLEHLSFKGTERRSTRRIAEDSDALGGNINAFTSRQMTCYYGRCVDEDLPACFDLLSDLTVHAVLPPDEMERERGVVLEEIAMAEDDPEDLCAERLMQAQYDYPRQSIGRPVLGTREQIASCTREALLRYRGRHYTPENCVVSLCGRFDPAQALDVISGCVGSWRGEGAVQAPGPAEVLDGQRVRIEKDTEQAQLGIGYPGFSDEAPDRPALLVLNTILGDSMSSRLFQRIREELGLAYSVCSVPSFEIGSGLMQVLAGVSPANLARVRGEIDRVIGEFAQNGPTEKEFLDAKRQIRIGYLLSQESNYGRMLVNGRRLLIKGGLRSPEEILRDFDAVTLEDAKRVAGDVFGHEPSVCVVGPGETAG